VGCKGAVNGILVGAAGLLPHDAPDDGVGIVPVRLAVPADEPAVFQLGERAIEALATGVGPVGPDQQRLEGVVGSRHPKRHEVSQDFKDIVVEAGQGVVENVGSRLHQWQRRGVELGMVDLPPGEVAWRSPVFRDFARQRLDQQGVALDTVEDGDEFLPRPLDCESAPERERVIIAQTSKKVGSAPRAG
jgi:hypothetical protein